MLGEIRAAYSTQCPVYNQIFQLNWRDQALCPALCECHVLFPIIFSGISFSCLRYFPHMHVLISIHLSTQGGPSGFPEFSMRLSPPLYLYLQTGSLPGISVFHQGWQTLSRQESKVIIGTLHIVPIS